MLCLVPCPVFVWGPPGLLATGFCYWVGLGLRSLNFVLTYLTCPLLYVFHLMVEKAEDGLCQCEIPVPKCAKDCIYLWVAFVVRHFILSVTLLTFTILFIYQLKRGEESFKRVDCNSLLFSRKVSENMRKCFVVTTVVVVLLVPEIPYSMLLLYNSLDLTFNMGKGTDIETNRIIHITYQLIF
jgi:hypothetical protein